MTPKSASRGAPEARWGDDEKSKSHAHRTCSANATSAQIALSTALRSRSVHGILQHPQCHKQATKAVGAASPSCVLYTHTQVHGDAPGRTEGQVNTQGRTVRAAGLARSRAVHAPRMPSRTLAPVPHCMSQDRSAAPYILASNASSGGAARSVQLPSAFRAVSVHPGWSSSMPSESTTAAPRVGHAASGSACDRQRAKQMRRHAGTQRPTGSALSWSGGWKGGTPDCDRIASWK